MSPTALQRMIVCGDIGGTKALLAVAEAGHGTPRFVWQQRYACADFGDFESLLARFRDDAAAFAGSLAGGCLAVAGPLADDGRSARITNLPWTVDARRCADLLGLPDLALANDFAAAAMGITAAATEQLVWLRAGEPLASAPRLVVGAGTGLGMALLLPEAGGRFRVVPGEGGHIGFSPQDAVQQRIHTALLAEHGRVTAERVVSGPGLASIHRILNGASAEPAAIAECALAGDAAAGAALDAFLAAYGAFAGDMALAVMARGGVYLAGGIAAKVLPALQRGSFLAAFDAKAEHAGIAARMPVAVATDPALGLAGAAMLAEALTADAAG